MLQKSDCQSLDALSVTAFRYDATHLSQGALPLIHRSRWNGVILDEESPVTKKLARLLVQLSANEPRERADWRLSHPPNPSTFSPAAPPRPPHAGACQEDERPGTGRNFGWLF